jgi:hypothetical protein
MSDDWQNETDVAELDDVLAWAEDTVDRYLARSTATRRTDRAGD